MKYVDFAIQTSILLLTILLVVSYGEHDWLLAVLYAQMVLGPWQYISSLISVITKAPFFKQKRIHLIVSTVYLLLLYLGTLENFHGINFPGELILPVLTIPAWTLGLYYFSITWRWTFLSTKKRSSFLPHLNF